MKRKVFFSSLTGLVLLGIVFLTNRAVEQLRLAFLSGGDLIAALDGIWGGILALPLRLSFEGSDLIVTMVVLVLLVITVLRPHRKFRTGEEHGSARWGTKRDIKPFIDPDWDNNLLLTQTERITMNDRPRDWQTGRNKNVLVIGNSGSGKTRNFVKPVLLQGRNNFVITDPKGTLIDETAYALRKMGYRVKAFNIMNAKGMAKSLRYNPLSYIKSEADILKFCDTLIANTNGEGKQSGDSFWENSEKLLYSALIGYMYYILPPQEQTVGTLLKLINASGAKEEDENYRSEVDRLFEALEMDDPENFAVLQYKKYKLAAGKRQSLQVSCTEIILKQWRPFIHTATAIRCLSFCKTQTQPMLQGLTTGKS